MKPWNQLQAARINVSEFLKDASAKTVLDLEESLKRGLIKFEKVFKENKTERPECVNPQQGIELFIREVCRRGEGVRP